MNTKRLLKLLSLSALAMVGVLAVTASAAQAEYVYLLNGAKQTTVHLGIINTTSGLLKAENGLMITCTGATGLALGTVKKTQITDTALATFTGCTWTGAETTCTINDPVTGKGTIHAESSGEVTMSGEEYFLKASSNAGTPFTTIVTEGAKCTIPEELEITGSFRAKILEPLTAATSHIIHVENESLQLGNSKVTELSGLAEVYDFLDKTATIAIHLCNLPSQPTC